MAEFSGADERISTMYRVICKRTGQVLAKNLTLDGVDKWVARNESKYASIHAVGMTIFVIDEA
jgi:hypothetical protein